MAKSMEDRKKTGPLSGIWTGIKGRHKALSNGSLFKPDIAPALKKYDQDLLDYDKLVEQKKKLGELIGEFSDQANNHVTASKKLKAELDKIEDQDKGLLGKNIDLLNKYKNDADSEP